MTGSTAFPGALDSFPAISSSTAMDASGVEHDVVHENVFAAILALQTKLGINGSTATASVDFKIAALLAAVLTSRFDEFTAATGDKYFSLPETPQALLIFKNGLLLAKSAYTLSGKKGQLVTAASSGDIIGFLLTALSGSLSAVTLSSSPIGDPYFSSVKVLMHCNGINGATSVPEVTGKSVTVSGAAALTTAYSLLGGASLRCPTTASSYVTIPANLQLGSQDWTIEMAVRVITSSSSFDGLFSIESTTGDYANITMTGSSGGLWISSAGTSWDVSAGSINTVGTLTGGMHWLVLQRRGSTIQAFLDGVMTLRIPFSGSFVQSGSTTVLGRKGNDRTSTATDVVFDEVRMSVGIARYANFSVPTTAFADSSAGDASFASVSALLHMDGSNGSTTFTDVTGKTWTATSATISTSQSKFGGASGYFNGSSYLSSASNAQFSMSGDFTIEFNVYVTAFTNQYATVVGNAIGTWGAGTRYIMIWGDADPLARKIGFGGFDAGGNPVVSSPFQLSANTWYHIALARTGTELGLFIDGILVARAANSVTHDFSSSGILIGANGWNGSASRLTGYVDDLRITKGVCRYSALAAAPSSEFQDS